MKSTLKYLSILSLALQTSLTLAQNEEDDASTLSTMEEVYVTGGADAIRSLPGSASLLDSEALKTFDSTDLNDVLGQVPGVYIRFEDGYGLRPNIGIRGATSDRSQKITLMEDGILIAPSPYSAPAAYYIPNVNRMDAIEVFKGPSSIQYGPHTVGGSLNMVTRAIPKNKTREISATLGNDAYQKYRLFYGDTKPLEQSNLGYWVDALHYGSDGFKELNDHDTGFDRNDINAKFSWQISTAKRPQKLIVKLGYADEESDETYLGLSDTDFAKNPVQRYAASAEDRFQSDHQQVHAIHSLRWNKSLTLSTRAYINRFFRDWKKLDGFAEPIDGCPKNPEGDPLRCTFIIQDILANPDRYPEQLAILRGERNSQFPGEKIDVTSNERQYGSQGIEVSGKKNWQMQSIQHTSTVGLRFHQDYVERNHQPFAFSMLDGLLIDDGLERDPKVLNKSEADAMALYLNHEMQWQKLKVTAGLRIEDIESSVTNYLNLSESTTRSDTIAIPGLGLFYQWNNKLGVLAGINKGFSPAVAGSDAEPEESVNYEYGFRYQNKNLTTDIISFYSDYSNLIGRCRVSDAGCSGTEEFNGGEADIAGVELTAEYLWQIFGHLTIPSSFVYTYTDATFASSFNSSFSQWGNVLEGDELPYTPRHQAKWSTGLESSNWSLTVSGKFVSRMREIPRQGSFDEGPFTPTYVLWDTAVRYTPNHKWDLLLATENIFDKQVIVSRRPFGARPNQPRTIKASATYSF